MIKSLKVVNLNQRMSFDLQFNEDINVVTGKNGSGKTTLLKLLWYAISGNMERIIQEIAFDSFELETDKVMVAIRKEPRQKRTFIIVRSRIAKGEIQEIEKPIERAGRWEELQEVNRHIAHVTGSSVFF